MLKAVDEHNILAVQRIAWHTPFQLFLQSGIEDKHSELFIFVVPLDFLVKEEIHLGIYSALGHTLFQVIAV